MRAAFFTAAALVTAASAMSSLATGPSAAARRFLLARHGETNFNAEGRIQGTLDSSQLTLRGIGQAAGLGHYVATHEACWSAPSGTRPDDWRMHRDQRLDAPVADGHLPILDLLRAPLGGCVHLRDAC